VKIETKKLTPLYDQYSNQENRLTHALMHTLAGSEKIFRQFLIQSLGIKEGLRGREFEISTQKRPFSQEDIDLKKVDSVPDGWIVENQGELGILIEVKDVKNGVRLSQLRSHLKRLAGYDTRYLLVITPDLNQPVKIDLLQNEAADSNTVIWKSWNELYVVFRKLRETEFQVLPKESYILDVMLDYLEHRREILGFQGIRFRGDYDVEEAKKILIAEMEALEETVHELFPRLTGRRGAITTAFSKSSVWDCFGASEGFTSDVHVTVSIGEQYHDISLTVPHGARHRWKRLKMIFNDKDLEDSLLRILEHLRQKVPDLFLEFIQRHFLYQRKSYRDAFLEFHIDTVGTPFKDDRSKIKEFPIWYSTIREAVAGKSSMNAQMMFKMRYYFSDTPNIDNEKFIDSAIQALKSLKPLYEFLTEEI
jgi:hypothetical protein